MGSLKNKSKNDNIGEDEGVYQLDPEVGTKQGLVKSGILHTVFILLAVVLVFMLSAGFGLFSSLRSELIDCTETTADFLGRYIEGDPKKYSSGGASYVENYAERDRVEMQLISADGSLIVSSSGGAGNSALSGDDFTKALSNVKTALWLGRNRTTGELVMASSSPVFSGSEVIGAVRCVSSMAMVYSTFLKLLIFALIIMVLIISFVTIAIRRMYRDVMVPISRINDTAQQIAEGTYGVHISTSYPGEIGELCHTLNDMSDAISRSEKLKNDFISSVSHELRTPLTAIGGWGETLLAGGTGDSDELRRGLTIITSEAGRLTRMVEELLDFSRMETGSLNMRMERIDFTPDIEDVVFMYMESIRREGITLEYDEADELPEIIGDRNRLRQVFLNLLDNAIKHGGEGKRVRVETYTENQTLVISVRDFGAGIPSEELPHVKERFYKGSSKARGSGIGLAVADEIMKLHGGRLDINSVIGEGTVATMVLPAIIGNPDEGQ